MGEVAGGSDEQELLSFTGHSCLNLETPSQQGYVPCKARWWSLWWEGYQDWHHGSHHCICCKQVSGENFKNRPKNKMKLC